MSPARSTLAVRPSKAAPLFSALGDETRLRIVSRLCAEGPLSITQLSEGADISRQAITKHLQRLSEAGLVRDARSGRERHWQLEPGRLTEARRYLEQISAQWDIALQRLKDYVED